MLEFMEQADSGLVNFHQSRRMGSANSQWASLDIVKFG